MRLNLSFLRIFPISLFFFFLDIKKGLDSLKPLFMRFPSHLIPNFPAKSLFLFFSHFKWLDTIGNMFVDVGNVSLKGISLCAIVAIILNLVLPKAKNEVE